MLRSKYTAVFAVLAALTLFFGGMFTYKVLQGGTGATAASTTNHAPGHKESFTVEGRAVIQIIRNGRVVTTWKGHNALYEYGKNAIVGCLSGKTTAPALFGKCSGYITHIYLAVSGGGCNGWCVGAAATNTLTPANCDPANGFPLCTGWTTEATLDINQNETVVAASAANGNINWFDQISGLSLAVNAGDRVDTKISFTVS